MAFASAKYLEFRFSNSLFHLVSEDCVCEWVSVRKRYLTHATAAVSN